MTHHVVCVAGPDDPYEPTVLPGDSVLLVPFNAPSHPDALRSSLTQVLVSHGITPTVSSMDLLHAAIGAYTADVRISRRTAHDGWTRDFLLHIVVQEPDLWGSSSAILGRLLSFLTGDRWKVLARHTPGGYHPVLGQTSMDPVRLNTDTVSLFSGGLDSYVGAIDALATREQVALVGHHASGQGPTSTAQAHTLSELRKSYAAERTPFLQFWLSPPRGSHRASETTTRGRSVLFLALGIAVASSLPDARLLVPENGFISLNVPLTAPRSGSFSTRTTHPHLIALGSDLLRHLDISVRLELPYRFRTKGEMLIDCVDQDALCNGLAITMSCAHPGAGRFVRGGNPNQHCGYCVPCLIRRAAIAAWRNSDSTSYIWDDLSRPLSPGRNADLRAVKLALERYERKRPTLAEVLKSGPLPGMSEDQSAYVGVFQRGLSELRTFIDHYG